MAAAFQNLEDTPMFRKQLYSLEFAADELRGRCQRLHRGCKRFMLYLGESCDGDIAFADSLEGFGAGNDDPLSVGIGGPVMSKFTTAIRELGTYKELLHSQVEHMLSNRLLEFINIDLQEVKDSRRQFEKAQYAYDQAREKFMSLKKGSRADVISELEEELQNAKSAFERCRFNLVSALANIEAKKKFEFLESVSAVMDAHMRYFKQGFELLKQMEPYIHEVLTYSQQSKEMTKVERDNLEKRIQAYRTNEELENLKSSGNIETPKNGDGIHIVGVSPYKGIEALMQSTAKGEVQTIKQGYLFKRPSGLRGERKKRFFVLDSHGSLYYYRDKGNKHAQGPQMQQPIGTSEQISSVFGRFRFSHRRSSSQGEENLSYRTIDLQTSTIKIDAEHTDLRFCFRIISPLKTYTLQAENATERADWVDKITAVIASILNSPFLKQPDSQFMSVGNAKYPFESIPALHSSHNIEVKNGNMQQDISEFLRNISGNDMCAECGSRDPDWASLNLGILLCIECSGVHRNLGVHISKVRSLTLDVKVWEPTMLSMLRALGNSYCNSIWEELLQRKNQRGGEPDELPMSIKKPSSRDAISVKEKFIHLKYGEKLFVVKETEKSCLPVTARMWEAVKTSDIKSVYHLLVASEVDPNTTYDMVDTDKRHHPMDLQNMGSSENSEKKYDPSNCPQIKESGGQSDCFQGCSLLHLACHIGELVMLELLLQFGADINMQDFHGRTPLHHCIFKGNNIVAKYLIKRGACLSNKDHGGQTPLERAMELGPITDEELFILLVESSYID